MNPSAPSPFTSFQYPAQSKVVMIYWASLSCDISKYNPAISQHFVKWLASLWFGLANVNTQLTKNQSKVIIYSLSPCYPYQSSYLFVTTADCSCRGRAVCKRPQGRHALNGESAACNQVLWVSKGHSRPKVTRVQSLNYIIKVCLRP